MVNVIDGTATTVSAIGSIAATAASRTPIADDYWSAFLHAFAYEYGIRDTLMAMTAPMGPTVQRVSRGLTFAGLTFVTNLLDGRPATGTHLLFEAAVQSYAVPDIQDMVVPMM